VTVADDGGSSGQLRGELGILPPGDLRNCLVALADPQSELAAVFQYRFESGEGLAGHALGNLVIAALADIEGDFAAGVAHAARLLGARGRVLPSTLEDVVLSGCDADGNRITGQANVAVSDGPVSSVRLEPEAPPAYPPALEAIAEADLVVIGPGSLFTSIIPNVLVAGVADALRATDATVVYVCNVANQRGETTGMDAGDHVEALVRHGLAGVIDVVIVQPPGPSTECPVGFDGDVRERIEALGARVVAADVVDSGQPLHHDPERLCAALRGVM
jgi:uncharacterized cofD-like protein